MRYSGNYEAGTMDEKPANIHMHILTHTYTHNNIHTNIHTYLKTLHKKELLSVLVKEALYRSG